MDLFSPASITKVGLSVQQATIAQFRKRGDPLKTHQQRDSKEGGAGEPRRVATDFRFEGFRSLLSRGAQNTASFALQQMRVLLPACLETVNNESWHGEEYVVLLPYVQSANVPRFKSSGEDADDSFY